MDPWLDASLIMRSTAIDGNSTPGFPARGGVGLKPEHFRDILASAPDIGRFSIAAIFWKSGQTKVQGFAIDIVSGEFTLGMPRLSDSVVELFRSEYSCRWS